MESVVCSWSLPVGVIGLIAFVSPWLPVAAGFDVESVEDWEDVDSFVNDWEDVVISASVEFGIDWVAWDVCSRILVSIEQNKI